MVHVLHYQQKYIQKIARDITKVSAANLKLGRL